MRSLVGRSGPTPLVAQIPGGDHHCPAPDRRQGEREGGLVGGQAQMATRAVGGFMPVT